MTGYYGGLSSLANMLGTFGGSEGAPWLKDVFDQNSEGGDSGTLGTIGAVGLPALLAGGLGYATGGKYGMANALPAALMGALSLNAGNDKKAEDAGGLKSLTPEQANAATPASNLNAAVQKNDPDQAGSTPQQKPVAGGSAAGVIPTTPQGQPSGMGSGSKGMGSKLGDLMNDPTGRFIASMMLSNMFSGPLQTMSSQSYMNQYNKNRNAADQAQTNQRLVYLGGLYNGRAMGGYINNTPVTDLSPQARIKSAQVNPAASPMGHEVIDPSALTMAHGGPVHGKGDGQSDDVQATVDGKEPIRLARGEFVVPKHIAEKHGDKLKSMMAAVRKAAHPHPGKQIKQDAGKREFIRHMSGGKVKA